MPLTLIGYRTSGKSSLGPLLAERLGWRFVDADEEIERRAGRTIAAIFAEDGEAGFRRREVDVMRDLLDRTDCVIAAGGGAVLSEETRRAMTEAGPVVYLRISPETAERRMRGDVLTRQRRPALTDLPGREEIETLMRQREPLYQECATVSVVADEGTIEEILEEVLRRLPVELRREAGR